MKYPADGTTQNFDACIYPARADKYATTPEGEYEATVGMHKSSYVALHMHNTGNTASESIDLGAPNPSNPAVNTATGIHIHKAGLSNKTGLTTDGKPISAGCLLIDVNQYTNFIGIFNSTEQKNNVIGVSVSRKAENGGVFELYRGNSGTGTGLNPNGRGTMLRDNSQEENSDMPTQNQ